MSTKIQWAQEVWNWMSGCRKVSPGCMHCYAERMAKRLRGRYGYPADDPFRVTVHANKMEDPLAWRKPKVVFTCSMGDCFHPDVPWGCQRWALSVMNMTPRHVYLMLTKRPIWAKVYFDGFIADFGRVPANLWLGVSAEDQIRLDERACMLMETPVAHRFLSLEPLLAPVDLRGVLSGYRGGQIEWVIVGGETGPGARSLKLAWLRSVRDQCTEAGVPLFIKQLGSGWARDMRAFSRQNAVNAVIFPDSKGSDPRYWPEKLQIREYPEWRPS